MAATIIDAIAIPRLNAGLSRRASAAAAPVSAASGRLGAHPLVPASRGLRIARPPTRSSVPAISGAAARRRAVICEAQEMAIEVPDVTKTTWQSLVLDCDQPVLVEFWASWCGPCRMIDPVIGKLSKDYEGKLKFFKLNTDNSPDIATQYGIRSIPTIMIFKNGEKKDTVIGAVPETTLVTCIEKFV